MSPHSLMLQSTPAWTIAPLPDNEAERLAVLAGYDILDTQPEMVFDRITRMAAEWFGVPFAFVSLVDHNRQWFKSHHGMEVSETPRDLAFCAHTIVHEGVMIVPDARQDQRFADNPLVTGTPDIRFYAGAPLRTGSGHALGTVCVLDVRPHHDITEQHKSRLADLAAIAMDELELRSALKRAHHDMATLRHTQRELEETRRKTELAITEKSQFIATISHELRTPMNGILGMAYLLGDTKLDAVQQEYVDTINHSASNLLLLINDVLDLSKIEASELITESVPFDIKTGFITHIRLLAPLAAKKGIGLFYTVDEKIPDWIIGDSCRFSQIVTNLVGNAVKFTEKGSVTATLAFDRESRQIIGEVTDTGIGIPPARREAVFEKFIQGDAAITRKYGGTGLGLAITRKLVQMLGGSIDFASEPGKGSRFWFTMPVLLPALALAEPPAEEKIFTAARRKATLCDVLIAEDNPVNHFFLEKLLGKFGFPRITIAANGVEALQALAARQKPYDVIFMDCIMPEKDGYDTTRAIRLLEQEQDMPRTLIIAMTANAMAGDRETCLQAGMDAYITKPLQPDALKEALSEWFVFAAAKDPAELEKDRLYNALPPVDMHRLAMVAETPDEKNMLMGLFFRIQEDAIQIMKDSRRNAEIQSWQNAAHRLRGSASNMGMKNLAYKLEKAETGNLQSYDGRTELLQEISGEIERIKQYMREYPG